MNCWIWRRLNPAGWSCTSRSSRSPVCWGDGFGTAWPLAQKNGNRLERAWSAEIGNMKSDMGKLRQCLLNLLSNAARFTSGGAIRLAAERDGDQAIFRVADTGAGMTAARWSGCSSPSSQVHEGARPGGTGLGLSITRRFCEMMGGEVSVESQPGRGSVFWLRLPVCIGGAGKSAGRVLGLSLSQFVVEVGESRPELFAPPRMGGGFEVFQNTPGESSRLRLRACASSSSEVGGVRCAVSRWSAASSIWDSTDLLSQPRDTPLVWCISRRGSIAAGLGRTEFGERYSFDVIDAEPYLVKDAGRILTPALLIYPECVAHNLETMIRMAGGNAARWRPHIKTAKIGAVIRQMIARGLGALKCSTTLELETACECGAEDVLLAFPVTGANGRRTRELAHRYPKTRVSVLAESAETGCGLVRQRRGHLHRYRSRGCIARGSMCREPRDRRDRGKVPRAPVSGAALLRWPARRCGGFGKTGGGVCGLRPSDRNRRESLG